MQRREALKMLLGGGVLSAIPADLFGFLRDSHPASGYTLRTLNASQNELVVAMIDQIIPATDTPGAKGARVNEFIDVILTEWANDEERGNFLNGLTDVDKQSTALFSKDFAAASPEQQLTLLRSLDETAAVARARLEPKKRPAFWKLEGRDTQMQDDFFTVFKKMTVHGYYTSEIGFSQELKLQIIPGAQHGCVPLAPGVGDA